MPSRLLYLSRADVERVDLDMPTIIGLLDRAFREKAAGRVEMPRRTSAASAGCMNAWARVARLSAARLPEWST